MRPLITGFGEETSGSPLHKEDIHNCSHSSVSRLKFSNLFSFFCYDTLPAPKICDFWFPKSSSASESFS